MHIRQVVRLFIGLFVFGVGLLSFATEPKEDPKNRSQIAPTEVRLAAECSAILSLKGVRKSRGVYEKELRDRAQAFQHASFDVRWAGDTQKNLDLMSEQPLDELPIVVPDEDAGGSLMMSSRALIAGSSENLHDLLHFKILVHNPSQRRRFFHLASEHRNFAPMDPVRSQFRAYQLLTALSMAPYAQELVVEVVIDSDFVTHRERQVKFDLFQKIQSLSSTGLSNFELVHQLDLAAVRFVNEYLPFSLKSVEINGVNDKGVGMPENFETDSYVIRLHYPLPSYTDYLIHKKNTENRSPDFKN